MVFALALMTKAPLIFTRAGVNETIWALTRGDAGQPVSTLAVDV
jgi:hypothetical protein